MKGDVLAGAALVGALACALAVQQPAREQHSEIKSGSDAYLLPPPQQLVVMSLGHRAALADVLWADLLVSQGLRLKDRRRFALVVNYLDGINELDPKFRDPYRMADSLITLQAERAPREEVLATRRILERGVHEHPMDAELWMVLGTFVGYIAPNSHLEEEPELAEAWRRDGAGYLARAAELAPKDEALTWQSIGSARVLLQTGQDERAIEMYSRVLATTEDPELQAYVTTLLEALQQRKQKNAFEAGVQQRKARRREMERLWHTEHTGASMNQMLLLGFPRDPARCAGGSRSRFAESAACAPSWAEWVQRASLEPGPADAR